MRHLLGRALLAWLPFAVALSAVVGLAYGLDQQNLRQGANDPQIQMAEDASARLSSGTAPGAVVPATPRVDIARSLEPFLVVYDSHDAPVASSASLDGAVPTLPTGVTASARSGEDRVTWQPRAGVRIAAVVVGYPGGAVLAGRSLRVVEQREDDALLLAAAAWLVGMIGTLGACTLWMRVSPR